jgi:thioredoxin 1
MPAADKTSAAIKPAGPAPITAADFIAGSFSPTPSDSPGTICRDGRRAPAQTTHQKPTKADCFWFLSQFHASDNFFQTQVLGYPMASDLIKHVSDASFEEDVLKSSIPVLVDYWAEWCGPCKMIAPILDEVSTTYQGKIQITKMNVDENRDVPAKFGIRGIPTLMLFKDGQLAATKVGAMSKAQLTAFIDQQLA